MKVNNKYDLPKPIVRFIESQVSEPHNKPGHYSITTLLGGPKERILIQRHFDEIEVEAAKEIWSVFGTVIHEMLSKRSDGEQDYSLSEYKMIVPVSVDDGVEVSITGTADLITDRGGKAFIEDYKTTKTWTFNYNDTTDRWREQLLGYAALLLKQGIIVQGGRIYALLKDWSVTEAKRKKDEGYPQAPVVVLEWEFTPQEIEQGWLYYLSRLMLHTAAEKLSDDDIEECTKDERWANEDRYALMKEGGKRAIKVFDTKAEAMERLTKEYGVEKYYIESRPGEDTKCLHFCKVNKYCHYYKNKYQFTLQPEGVNKEEN